MNILLIEENPLTLLSTCSFLESRGFCVHRVSSNQAILEHMESSSLDVILLDCSHSGVFQMDAFLSVRALTQGYPLVVFSSEGSQENAIEAVRNGAQDYVVLGVTSGDSIIRTLQYAVERNKVEKSLREGQDRLKAILENSFDAFISMDCDWNITDWNALSERTFGWNKDEVLGQNFSFIIPQYLKRPFLRGIKEKFSGQEGNFLKASGGILAVHRSGREFPIEYGIFKIKGDTSYMYCAFVHDVTEKKNAKELLEKLIQERTLKLTQSNEELRQFAKIASHDLQEPLRAIQGFIALLSENVKGKMDSDSDEYLDFIDKGAARMQELIKSILQHSQIKRFTDEEFITDCNSVIEEVVRNLKDVIVETETNLEVNLLPEVGVERSQMVQLFQNLIGNAIKYHGPNKPSIYITAEKIIDKWLFSVRDKSIGIDSTNHDKIFDMFTRLHGPSRYRGTGMGLAICKKIVNSYGGSIWVESKLGEGSIFFFLLPAVKKTNDPAENKNIQILLVEDSPADVKLTKEALRRSGLRYDLTVMSDGAEAMHYLKERKTAGQGSLPAIILLDLNMPNMNGHEVLNEINRDPDFRQIPVIVLTVSDRDEDISKALKLKMNYYVPKPVSAKKISVLIKSFYELNLQDFLCSVSRDYEETHVRLIMAGNPHTSASVLRRLSTDPDEKIRCRVAENEHAPAEVLEELASDQSVIVRLGVCENSNTSSDLLQQLAADPSEDVRLGLSQNPKCPVEILKVLADDNNVYVSEAATRTLTAMDRQSVG